MSVSVVSVVLTVKQAKECESEKLIVNACAFDDGIMDNRACIKNVFVASAV